MDRHINFFKKICDEIGCTEFVFYTSDGGPKYLWEAFCISETPNRLFSTKTFQQISADDLFDIIGTALDNGFVIEWLFDFKHVGNTRDKKTESILETPSINALRYLSEVVYSKAEVPEFPEEMYLAQNDGADCANSARLGMEIFWKLAHFISLHTDLKGSNSQAKYDISIYSTLLCMEQCEKHKWSDDESMILSSKLLELVMAINLRSIQSFFLMPSNWQVGKHCCDDVFKILQPKLGSKNWKLNPALHYVFVSVVKNITFPHLSECLNCILPPTLLFLDDFEEDHILQGMDTLNHILKNASKSEMRWFGRSEVIFDCLIKQLYTRSERVLGKLLTNLCAILEIVEDSPSSLKNIRKESKCDKTVLLILKQMQIENKVTLRNVYCNFLPGFLQLLGLTSLKHMKLTLNVIFSYLERSDGKSEESRIQTLKLLLFLIQLSWPRVSHHSHDIVKSLIRLIHELSTDFADLDEANVKEMLNLISSCFRTLYYLFPDIETYFRLLLHRNLGTKFDSMLRDISNEIFV